MWLIAKSLMKRDGQTSPTAIHCPSGLRYHLSEKANAIADCLENQFTPHDLCEDKHERLEKDRIQVLLEAVDNDPQK
jgi:hypothetical protein